MAAGTDSSTLLGPGAFLRRAGSGHCGETSDSGECTIGSHGSFGGNWPFPKALPDQPSSVRKVAAWCLKLCEACARCNYISVSVKFKDCAPAPACARPAASLPAAAATRHTATAASRLSLIHI